jgi:cardiolipin synthase
VRDCFYEVSSSPKRPEKTSRGLPAIGLGSARIYRKWINPTKAVLVDHNWLMVGSANIDNRSMRLGFELNVLINSPEQAVELQTLLQNDLDNSNEIDLAEFKRPPLSNRICEAIVRPMAPLL